MEKLRVGPRFLGHNSIGLAQCKDVETFSDGVIEESCGARDCGDSYFAPFKPFGRRYWCTTPASCNIAFTWPDEVLDDKPAMQTTAATCH